MSIQITPEILAGAVGIIISLVLSYTPKLKQKWAKLDPDYKRLIFLGLLILVSVVIVVLSCYGLAAWIVCSQAGLIEFIEVLISAIIASQSVYAISPAKVKNGEG